MYGYIYKTTNLINFTPYIGQRKGEFDPTYLGSGKMLWKAIRKYGIEKFKVEPIAYAEDKNELNVLEIYYIKKYKQKGTCYNIAEGGTGGDVGPVSKATRKKQSVAMPRRYQDPKERRKTRLATKKAFANPEVRKKLTGRTPWNKNLTKRNSPSVARISKAMRGNQNGVGQICWARGLTKETDIRIAKSAKKREGKPTWNTGLKGVQVGWSKGQTKETNPSVARIAKALKGNKNGEEQVGWNTGLTKKTDKRIAKISKAISKALKGNQNTKGIEPWNKNLTKETYPRVAKVWQTRRENCQLKQEV